MSRPNRRWETTEVLLSKTGRSKQWTFHHRLLYVRTLHHSSFILQQHLHDALQQTGVASHWPLIGVIAFSWLIAFFEYCCQVPANRIGYEGNGGPYSLVQLKVIQECISLIVFAVIANMLFQGQGLHWNHIAAFVCLIAAVYFVFL